MNQIFLSYSRTDQPFALKLAEDLRKSGIDVWIDRDDITPAEHWDEEIQRGLDASTGVAVLISRASVNSDNVLNEINYAIEQKKPVWPLLIETNIIKPLNINRLQHIDFTDSYEFGLVQLLGSFQHKTVEKPAARAERKNQWIIAIVAAAVLIVVSFFLMRGSFSSNMPAAPDVVKSTGPQPLLNGSWITDEITNPFDPNDKYTLEFNISTANAQPTGSIESRSTANGKGYHSRKAFTGGKTEGNKFSFFTMEESIQGSEKFRYKNYYTGTFSDDSLQFTISSDRPWDFPEQYLVARSIRK